MLPAVPEVPASKVKLLLAPLAAITKLPLDVGWMVLPIVILAPVTVRVREVVPPATVKPSAWEVRAILLIDVAVAAPSDGVVRLGEVAMTELPVPVVLFQVIVPPLFCRTVKPVEEVTAVIVLAVLAAKTEPKAAVPG